MLFIPPRLRFFCPAILVALASSYDLFGYTKAGTTYTTDGSQSDVSAAIANASAGDTVSIPAGTFTWGAGQTFVTVNKAITLAGAGPGATNIALSITGPSMTAGAIRIAAACTIRDFTINGAASGNPTPFSTTGAGSGYVGWRITNITYNAGSSTAYFIYVGNNYGLVDNCTISSDSSSAELIFARGPTNSWQTASSMGTQNALYVEDCTFGGVGYVSDINDNGRAVFRFNTINGHNQIDAHGYASNGLRSVRHMEVYDNHWTASASAWAAIELRGGTGMVFENVSDYWNGSAAWPDFYLVEYGCLNLWSNFGRVYQTPADYPIKDQIGVGMDPIAGGSEPYYLWDNIAGGVDWSLHWKAVPQAAQDYYGQSFTMQDIIAADRDYFKGTEGGSFDGSSGVGRGTKAAMLALNMTGRTKPVGFWVTDEGSWNTKLPAGTSGRLYAWNGHGWVLKYTPYTYPHPLRGATSPPTNATTSINVQ